MALERSNSLETTLSPSQGFIESKLKSVTLMIASIVEQGTVLFSADLCPS